MCNLIPKGGFPMKGNGTTLESILKRAESLSKKLGKLQSDYKEIKNEKTTISRKESSIEKKLIELTKSMIEFHHDSIATLKDLYTKTQNDSGKKKEPESGNNKPTVKEDTMDKNIEKKERNKVEIEDIFEVNLQADEKKETASKVKQDEIAEFEVKLQANEKKEAEPKVVEEVADIQEKRLEDTVKESQTVFEVNLEAVEKKEIEPEFSIYLFFDFKRMAKV